MNFDHTAYQHWKKDTMATVNDNLDELYQKLEEAKKIIMENGWNGSSNKAFLDGLQNALNEIKNFRTSLNSFEKNVDIMYSNSSNYSNLVMGGI